MEWKIYCRKCTYKYIPLPNTCPTARRSSYLSILPHTVCHSLLLDSGKTGPTPAIERAPDLFNEKILGKWMEKWKSKIPKIHENFLLVSRKENSYSKRWEHFVTFQFGHMMIWRNWKWKRDRLHICTIPLRHVTCFTDPEKCIKGNNSLKDLVFGWPME